MISIKRIFCLSFLICLTACGGGGGGGGSAPTTSTTAPTNTPSSNTPTFPTSTVNLATPSGLACTGNFNNTDAFGNIQFELSIGNTAWGCLAVDQANGQPVVSGSKSVRFEIRPGDCDSTVTFISGSNNNASDCTTDRSRYEIYQIPGNSTSGQLITYSYSIFIPGQAFQPPPKNGESPLTVLTQINWQCHNTPCPSLGSNGYGALAYLKIDYTGTLSLQTHQGFTWTPNQVVTVDSNPFNKWIKLTFVIKSTPNSDGYIKIYANDSLLINETRATLPNSDSTDTLKVGIYDSFLSAASQAWETQVVYFDNFNASVSNF